MITFSHALCLPDGVDYTFITTSFTFPTGSQIGTRQCINVPIIDDIAVENTEVFHLRLSTSDPRVQLSSICNRATINIYDNDGELKMSLLDYLHCTAHNMTSLEQLVVPSLCYVLST